MLLVDNANDASEGLSDDGKAKICQNIVKCLKCALQRCRVKKMQDEIRGFKKREFDGIKAPGEWHMILQTEGWRDIICNTGMRFVGKYMG